MPIDYSRYPPNWKTEIRPAILERAGHKCEECGLPNHAIVVRSKEGAREIGIEQVDAAIEDGEHVVKIVLTISHTDHDITNNDPANLRALCQKCHNAHDSDYRNRNRAETRRRKRVATGQMEML